VIDFLLVHYFTLLGSSFAMNCVRTDSFCVCWSGILNLIWEIACSFPLFISCSYNMILGFLVTAVFLRAMKLSV